MFQLIAILICLQTIVQIQISEKPLKHKLFAYVETIAVLALIIFQWDALFPR